MGIPVLARQHLYGLRLLWDPYLFRNSALSYLRPRLLTEIMTWISNYIDVKQWDVITHPCPNFNGIEVRAWMGNYIPLFYMDIITYSCLNLRGPWHRAPAPKYITHVCLTFRLSYVSFPTYIHTSHMNLTACIHIYLIYEFVHVYKYLMYEFDYSYAIHIYPLYAFVLTNV